MSLTKNRALTEKRIAGIQAERETREPARHLVENFQSRQLEICDAERKAGSL